MSTPSYEAKILQTDQRTPALIKVFFDETNGYWTSAENKATHRTNKAKTADEAKKWVDSRYRRLGNWVELTIPQDSSPSQ